jgi:hypothetical protein
MRAPRFPSIAALALAACARVGPLQATDPDQAIDAGANEAQTDLAGVTVHAAIGGWKGRPKDLEQRLTPVDVTVRNTSGRTLRLGPEAFTLRTPSGANRALDQGEVAVALRDVADSYPGYRGPRVGAVGGPAFPGYDTPGDPYGPGSRSPGRVPLPPPSQVYRTQPMSGTLANGATTSILLFFGTPARTISTATFEVDLVDESGQRLGTAKMPFGRE